MSRLVPARCPGEAIGSSLPTRGLRERNAWRPAIAALAAAVLLISCATAPPQAVPPGPFEPLAEGVGFLVIHVDTRFAVEKIDAGRVPIARDLQPGDYLWLVRIQAGRYRWSTVRLAAQTVGSSSIRLEAVAETKEKEFEFAVEPGRINYPGHLVIGSPDHSAGIAAGVEIRNRNHSAMAVRKLLRSHAELMAAHPVHYAGTSDDEFLDFYTRERDRLRRPTPKAAARSEASR